MVWSGLKWSKMGHCVPPTICLASQPCFCASQPFRAARAADAPVVARQYDSSSLLAMVVSERWIGRPLLSLSVDSASSSTTMIDLTALG